MRDVFNAANVGLSDEDPNATEALYKKRLREAQLATMQEAIKEADLNDQLINGPTPEFKSPGLALNQDAASQLQRINEINQRKAQGPGGTLGILKNVAAGSPYSFGGSDAAKGYGELGSHGGFGALEKNIALERQQEDFNSLPQPIKRKLILSGFNAFNYKG